MLKTEGRDFTTVSTSSRASGRNRTSLTILASLSSRRSWACSRTTGRATEPMMIEVEDVPAAPEEVLRPTPVGGEPQDELDDEDQVEGAVEEHEDRGMGGDDTRIGLEPEHHGVGDDDGGDDAVEAVGVDQASEPAGTYVGQGRRGHHQPNPS